MWARTRRMAGTRDSAGREVMGCARGRLPALIDALAERIRELGGEVAGRHGGATDRATRRPRRGVVVDGRLRAGSTTSSARSLPPQGRRLLGAELAERRRADHCRYLGVHLPVVRTRRERQPVLHAEHHRPAVGADDGRRDDARRRSRARRRAPALRHEVRRPATPTWTADARRGGADVPRAGAAHPADPRRRGPSSARRCSVPAPSSPCTSSAARAGCRRCSRRPGLAMASTRARVPRDRQRPGGARRRRQGRRRHPRPASRARRAERDLLLEAM